MRTGFLHEGIVVEEGASPYIDDIEFDRDVSAEHLLSEGMSEAQVDTLRFIIPASMIDATDRRSAYFQPSRFRYRHEQGGGIFFSTYNMPGSPVLQARVARHEMRHAIQFADTATRVFAESVRDVLNAAAITVPVTSAYRAWRQSIERGNTPLSSTISSMVAGTGALLAMKAVPDLYYEINPLEVQARKSEIADSASFPDGAIRITFKNREGAVGELLNSDPIDIDKTILQLQQAEGMS